MKKKIKIVTSALIVFFCSCSKDSPEQVISEPNVYIVGIRQNPVSYDEMAVYWKNGVETALTNGVNRSFAKSIFVLNNDVHIVGTEDETYNVPSAKYWKNGLAYTLATNAEASSVYVVGVDVYVCGKINTTSGNSYATYWKNGIATHLTNGTNRGDATDIVIVNNDIYIAGKEGNVAKYWKNGTATNLSDGTYDMYANKIAVTSNNDVVVGGYQHSPHKLVYWKNGIQTFINNSTGLFDIFSMTTYNNDVYIIGYEGNKAKYWKNGVGYDVTDGTEFAIAQAMDFYNGNMYIAGYQDKAIKLWKNGVPTTIATNTISMDAYDMFLTN